MVEKVIDVGIIGAGPAGSSTAIHLSSGCELNIALFEKKKNPGFRKTRPGATRPSVISEYEIPEKIIGSRVEEISIYCDEKEIVSIKDEMVTVKRKMFDNHLKLKAKKLGCKLLTADVRAVKREDDKWGIVSKRGQNFCRVLVFADGATSAIRSRQKIGFIPKKNFFVTASIFAKGNLNPGSIKMFCNQEVSKMGYAWSIPVGEYTNFGVCLDSSLGKKDIKSLFRKALPDEEFKLMSGSKNFDISILPCEVAKKLSSEKSLVVGDAAGLVSPISGEGILYALESGKIAAEAIRDSFENNDFSMKIYGKMLNKTKWYKMLKDESKIISRVRRFRNPFPKYVKLLTGTSKLIYLLKI